MKKMTLTIDEKACTAEEGMTLLETAQNAGITIPTLCYHKGVTPSGSCRLCTVEIFKGQRSRLVTACTYPAEEGIEVKTNSAAVRKTRRMLLELLLARCPNVPILQQLGREYGVEKFRLKKTKNEDCILCGLCTQVCQERMGVSAINFVGRGVNRTVDFPFERMWDVCVACGACTYVCPTGHVQNEAHKVAQLKRQLGIERKCRYMLMGAVSNKLCPHNYECWRCEYDQRTEYRLGGHPALRLKLA
ncbi:MAG: 2Fe-2S iron-sulfur cluster-binding protein [Thermodesulfobacteriota bacterium]